MIKGIGTDLVSITRIEQAILKHGNRFAEKLLHADEYQQFLVSHRKANFLAKRFASKEAAVKALGTGFSKGIRWKDIELVHDSLGKPTLKLYNKALERFDEMGGQQILISLSDEESMVIAYAILE